MTNMDTEYEFETIESATEIENVDRVAEVADLIEGGTSGYGKSILTFNASVSNKKLVLELKTPYQIMASTRNYLTTQTINSYPESKNPNLLLHMNYITRPFNVNAIESGSRERQSLRQYAKLAERLGTRDVLIHMPSNVVEYKNIAQGLKVIDDELCKHGIVCHLEIAAWSQELITFLKVRGEDPLKYVPDFVDQIVDMFKHFKKGEWKIVFDTAHLYALGCEVADQIELFKRYREHMKYAHLNGNVNAKYTSDSHAPIMSSQSKIKNWELLSKFIATQGLICVAEITKYGKPWSEWEAYAKTYGFELVPFHEQYSI